MTEFAAITNERHANKVWKRVTDYAFAAEDTVIPLVGVELSKAALAMPTKVDGVGPTQLIESSPLLTISRQYLVLKAQITMDKAVLRKKLS